MGSDCSIRDLRTLLFLSRQSLSCKYKTSARYFHRFSTLSKRLCSDGAEGVVQYRGHNIADFWQTAEFEDLVHLLVWGHWPSTLEKEVLKDELFKAAQIVPESVTTVIYAFPYVQSKTLSSGRTSIA